MFRSGFVLGTPEQISAAIHQKTPVDVAVEDRIIEKNCIIVSQNQGSIATDHGKYLKAVCEFRVR